MKKFILFASVLLIPIVLFSLFGRADGDHSWTQDLQNVAIYNDGLVIHPTNSQIMYAASNDHGVYLSVDGGTTWIPSNTGITGTVEAIAISRSNPDILFVGTATNGVYKTTNGGSTWTAVNTGITESANDIEAIDISPTNPNNVVICIYKSSTDATIGVYKTTNGGTSWAASNTGMGLQLNCLCMVTNPLTPNTIYMGSTYSTNVGVHIYKSFNFGNSWFDISNGMDTGLTTGNDPFRCLSYSTADTNLILAGRFWNTSNGGPWITTNGGNNWHQSSNGIVIESVPGHLIRSVLIKPGSATEFFFGGGTNGSGSAIPGGVWRSTNAGATWFNFNPPYTTGVLDSNMVVRALCMRPIDQTLFAGVTAVYSPSTGTTGIYEYSFAIGVRKIGNDVPKTFTLQQNYPNPFNPTTFINFEIPKNSDVSINVYDITGKLVDKIIDKNMQSGSYQISYDASKLTSGVYFYRLSAGNFVDTKKMILVK